VVDVKDTESIWCQGTILEVYQKYDPTSMRNKTVAVLVHYNRWNNIYNEIIDVPTVRLAPQNYFSSRSDIPHYNLAEDDGNMRGSVATGMRV
jgi:hypothetical protein